MYLSVKSIHSERLGWYNSARMTSFAKEWQFDYEKACSTLQSLRGTPSPAEWQVRQLVLGIYPPFFQTSTIAVLCAYIMNCLGVQTTSSVYN